MRGQLEALPAAIRLQEILAFEEELSEPQGIRTIPAYPLVFEMASYSENCNSTLHLTAKGIQTQIYLRKAGHYAALAFLVSAVELYLGVKQTQYTHATAVCPVRWRGDLTFVGIRQSVVWYRVFTVHHGCIYELVLHHHWGIHGRFVIEFPFAVPLILTEPHFFAISAAAFVKLVHFTVFEMRFLLQIWKANRSRQGVTDGRLEALALHSFFYIVFLGFVLLLDTRFVQLMMVLMHCYWVPQIMLNFRTGSRRPLLLTYHLGMSALRLLPVLYIYWCPENALHLDTDNSLAVSIIALVAFQNIVLYVQRRLGPQGLLAILIGPSLTDRTLGTSRHDYHQQLMSTNAPDSSCAVCLELIVREDACMTTPCNHRFHRACLEGWLNRRLICPVCREDLPE